MVKDVPKTLGGERAGFGKKGTGRIGFDVEESLAVYAYMAIRPVEIVCDLYDGVGVQPDGGAVGQSSFQRVTGIIDDTFAEGDLPRRHGFAIPKDKAGEGNDQDRSGGGQGLSGGEQVLAKGDDTGLPNPATWLSSPATFANPATQI